MDNTYYILSLNSTEYSVLRNSRAINVPNHYNFEFERGYLFLVYLKDENMLVAEYDLEDYVDADNDLTLNLEPIYNSPHGLQINDLILLLLGTYTLDDWKNMLKTAIFPINQQDYDELVTRLKL